MILTGVIIKHIMIDIGRTAAPRDTLLSTITDITDGLIDSGNAITTVITIITVIKQCANTTTSINHPTIYFATRRRSSIRDGPSSSKPKAGGKLNKSVSQV
jgi:hypothetical protein